MGRGDGEKEAKRRRRGRSSKRSRHATPSSDSDSSPSSASSSPSRSPGPRSRSGSKPEKSSSSRRRRHHRKSSGRSRSSRDDDRRRHRRRRRDERARHGSDASDLSGSGSDDSGWMEEAQEIVRGILSEFPAITSELRQLLQMIDSGEGIDISGISDKPLVKRLKKLFRSLKLKESANGAYLLAPKGVPTLDVVGPVLEGSAKLGNDPNETVASRNRQQVPSPNFDVQNKDDIPPEDGGKVDREEDTPIKRVIGPAMPSRELLAAAAEMTEALRCRDAELEADDGFLIGPPPPAMVAEAASANEAERFEEVTRILGADADALYDVLGINWKMSPDNIKKRYWKLSLLVHPDKCPHPSAQEAFVKLNNAFKDLQDPQKGITPPTN
ncbi:hypothetical protein ZWY2020_012633 [Hordeum vulgare]|nr:hypothetical protein ZWY2020_012633 [Hordeum vulgare]